MMHKKHGKLILISGPMYAGKSRKLIQIYNELVKDKKKAIAISPAEDFRTKQISSRNGAKIPTIKVETIKDIEGKIKNYDFIFIDEFHFFNEELIYIIKKILKKNKTVVLSGLDKDFKAINFEAYDKLKEMADQEIKMTAICHTCKNIASYSRKDENKSDANSRIEVDDFDNTIYFSSCGKCHPYIDKENE
jgi:thymidine kinase